MTLDELANLISSISYKPGFTIKLDGDYFEERENPIGFLSDSNSIVEQMGMDRFHIRIDIEAVDADDPTFKNKSFLSKKIALIESEVEYWNTSGAIHFIFSQLQEMEIHELREFFRVGGVKTFNPHLKN